MAGPAGGAEDEVSRLVENDPVPDWMIAELRDAGVPEAADWWPQEVDGQALSADERYIGLLTRPRGSPAVDPLCRIDVTSVARMATAVARPHT